MQYRMFAPCRPLASFVEAFWAGETDAGTPGVERILPSGTIELVVDLRDARRGAIVCGPHTSPFLMERAARESFVGVHFKAGGAAPFLGVPADELRDALVPLEALWGRDAGALCARLLDAESPEQRVRALERALLERTPHPALRHAGVVFALRELERVPAARPVAELGEQAGLSARRFIERFAEQVGLTPKLFARVRHFQTVLTRANAAPQIDWPRLALACGYYDQAHLIRDFRGFAALAPSEYLRRRTGDPNHVPHLA